MKRFPAGHLKNRLLTKAKQNIQTEIWSLPCVETRNQAKAEVQSAPSKKHAKMRLGAQRHTTVYLACHQKESVPLFLSNSCRHKRRLNP